MIMKARLIDAGGFALPAYYRIGIAQTLIGIAQTLICQLEIRSRGLRLYAAWASGVSNVIQTRSEDWPGARLGDAAEDLNSGNAVA